MEIVKTGLTPHIIGNYKLQFGSSQTAMPQNKQIDEIQNVTPQYNISKPIAYNHIEDIKLPDELTAHYYKLSNGQRVVIVPKKGTTVVKTYVNTGSLNEPDNLRGISHYIEHNLFNGSEALGDKVFFDEVSKMGAFTNASTSFSVTDYFIESNMLDDNDLENKIKLQAGMLQSPKFLEEKLAKEKKIVNSEINMCLSDDSSRAETITLKNLFGIKSTSPDLVAGSTDNIDALTREDVINYFNNNYYPANMVTVITGEVEPQNAIELVSKYFNSTKTPSTPRLHQELKPIEKSVRQDLISDKTQGAANIFLGFSAPENNNIKDKVYLQAVNELLFDLNNAKIRDIEKKYSTFIYSETERLGSRPQDNTAKVIHASVPERYVEPLLKDLYSVLGNIKPTEEEFEAIKNHMKKTNSIYMQSSFALNQYLGLDFINSATHATADYNDIIDNMTYKDFIRTAKKYYDLNKVSLTVVHPSGTSEEEIKTNYKTTKTSQISFSGAMKKVPIDISKVKEYTLENNFDVTLQDSDSDVINYSLVINKKDYSPQKAAASDVLNDILSNCGTINRSKEDVDKIFDQKAIEAGLVSSSRSLSLFGDFPKDEVKSALELFKEKITTPNFDEDTFKQAIKHCRDNYSTVEPNAGEAYSAAVYKNTPLAATSKEKLESLDNITLDDIKQLYNDILKTGQGHMVITAPFSKNPELKNLIFENAASYNKVQPKDVTINKICEPIEKAQVYTTETKRNQAEILQGYKFSINGNIKDDLCLQILTHILGGSPSSRLFSDLREKRHLAYSVNSHYFNIDDIGVMTLAIETTANNLETGEKSYDNIEKSIKGFSENIEKIKTEKVSETELETAKKALKTAILSNLEMNADQTIKLSSDVTTPYGINYINEKFDLIDSITADDILNTAKYVFKGNPVYSISGTKDALEANAEFLNNLA